MPAAAATTEAKYGLLQEMDISDEQLLVFQPKPFHHRLATFLPRLCVVLNVLLLCLSTGLMILSYKMTTRSQTSNEYFRKINNYSPILERLDLPLRNHTMDGYLFDVTHSAFRGEPGPESNAEWERVSQLGPMIMSGEEVRKVGKNPAHVVKAPLEWGYGDDAYIWQFEMQHNIHCLSFIRQYAYFDHYYRPTYASFKDTPKLDRIHLSHCLYYILQDLRCQPSLNPLTFNWMDGWRTPNTDFNLHRQCVDHEEILRWQLENKVDPKGKVIVKPEDAWTLHGPEGMEQLLEE